MGQPTSDQQQNKLSVALMKLKGAGGYREHARTHARERQCYCVCQEMRRTSKTYTTPIAKQERMMKIGELTNCVHFTWLASVCKSHECHTRASQQFRIWVRVRINKHAAIQILAIPSRFSFLTAHSRAATDCCCRKATCKTSISIGRRLSAI